MTTEFQIEEYKRLTKEIETSAHRVYQIITIVISFSTVIISISVQEKVLYFLPLALHILLIIALILISSQVNATYRIATYIHLIYENSETNIFWESNLIKQKDNRKVKSKYNFAIFLITIIFGVIAQAIATIKLFEIDESLKISTKNVEIFDLYVYFSASIFALFGYIRGFISIMKSKDIQKHFNFWSNSKD